MWNWLIFSSYRPHNISQLQVGFGYETNLSSFSHLESSIALESRAISTHSNSTSFEAVAPAWKMRHFDPITLPKYLAVFTTGLPISPQAVELQPQTSHAKRDSHISARRSQVRCITMGLIWLEEASTATFSRVVHRYQDAMIEDALQIQF